MMERDAYFLNVPSFIPLQLWSRGQELPLWDLIALSGSLLGPITLGEFKGCSQSRKASLLKKKKFVLPEK